MSSEARTRVEQDQEIADAWDDAVATIFAYLKRRDADEKGKWYIKPTDTVESLSQGSKDYKAGKMTDYKTGRTYVIEKTQLQNQLEKAKAQSEKEYKNFKKIDDAPEDVLPIWRKVVIRKEKPGADWSDIEHAWHISYWKWRKSEDECIRIRNLMEKKGEQT